MRLSRKRLELVSRNAFFFRLLVPADVTSIKNPKSYRRNKPLDPYRGRDASTQKLRRYNAGRWFNPAAGYVAMAFMLPDPGMSVDTGLSGSECPVNALRPTVTAISAPPQVGEARDPTKSNPEPPQPRHRHRWNNVAPHTPTEGCLGRR